MQIVQMMRLHVQILNLSARVWLYGLNVCMAHILVSVSQRNMNVVTMIRVWTTLPLLTAVSFFFYHTCCAQAW